MNPRASHTCAGWLCASTLLLIGCLEPNPNADAGETGTASTTATTTATTATDPTATDTGPPPCDPCEFAFEQTSFEAGGGGFNGSVPKPDQPHTVPLVIIDAYAPGNADDLGWDVTWTDAGGAWDVDITVSGGANNSRVRGRAIVLGFATEPSVADIQVSGADGCGSAVITDLGGLTIVDAIESYQPGADAVLSYARSVDPGADTIEYCVTSSDTPEAAIGVKLIGFAAPEGVNAIEAGEVTLASQAPQSDSYPQLVGAQILHMLIARGYDDSSANNLGYAIDCNPNAAPYGCNFDLSGFKAGAQVVAGGAIVAIQ